MGDSLRRARRMMPCLALSLLFGCQSRPVATSFEFPAAKYPEVFAAARDVLRDSQFELERVDARAGVITSRDMPSAGWATPWRPYAQTTDMAWDDLLNNQRRTARLAFVGPEPSPDLRTLEEGSLRLEVEVVLERRYRPGRQVSPVVGRRSSFAIDPALVARDMQPNHDVAVSRDDALAANLAAQIKARTGVLD